MELVDQGFAMDMTSAIEIVTNPKNGYADEVAGDPFR